MIRKAVAQVDPGEMRAVLNEKIKDVFKTQAGGFELVPFPAGPYEIPDEIGDGRPFLVVLGYDAFTVTEEPTSLPGDIVRMATRAGAKDDHRKLQNNLVFVVADDRLREEMRQAVRHRLALEQLRHPDRVRDLADHQQRKLNELFEKAPFNIAVSIMQCYRHLFYPSHIALGGGDAQLAHTAVEVANASEKPGNGQTHVRRALREQKKLLSSGDDPDAPAFVRDQTPLRTKGQITTLDLRNEYRRAPKLSILLDDEPLIRCVRDGIEHDVFVYREGELVWGKGDPTPTIKISENAFVHTVANAKELSLWPRKPAEPATATGGTTGTGTSTGGTGTGTGTGTGAGTGTGGGTTTVTTPADLQAEGPLQQALTELFEQARKNKVKAVTEVRIKLFQAREAWNVHQAVATYRDARRPGRVRCEPQRRGHRVIHRGLPRHAREGEQHQVLPGASASIGAGSDVRR